MNQEGDVLQPASRVFVAGHRGRLPRLSFERAALACAIAFVGWLISRYDVCFQDPDVLSGIMFDQGERGRLLNYLANIATLEVRLALWEVLPPHPSFTPVWVLTLLVGPMLLYKFLQIELGGRPAAVAGSTVYLVSTGCLSGVIMLFYAAKPLANVAIIATLYLSARINRAMPHPSGGDTAVTPPRRLWLALLTVLAAAPFTDETAAFAYAIPLVWCPRIFWPRPTSPRRRHAVLANWLAYAIPACVVVVVLFILLPWIVEVMGRRLDLLDYMRQMAAEGAQYSKLDLRHIVWHAGNLLTPGLLPWEMAGVQVPHAQPPRVPVLLFGGLAAIGLLATVLVRRGRVHWPLYRKLGILSGLFIVFQWLVVAFHVHELAATGFHYGAIFSVFFASLVAVVFADARGRPSLIAMWGARLGLAWVLVVSAMNVQTIGASWRVHSNADTLAYLPPLGHGANMGPLLAYSERREQGAIDIDYVEDLDPPTRPFAEILTIWNKWRLGDGDFLAGRPIGFRTFWVAVELDKKTRGAPRPWQRVLAERLRR
ncbi:MAG: hypothetical protein EXQ59_03685 [Acidobacteria bacterium]|nr:hypothetical protein [Acidobacteriota bacterium]